MKIDIKSNKHWKYHRNMLCSWISGSCI